MNSFDDLLVACWEWLDKSEPSGGIRASQQKSIRDDGGLMLPMTPTGLTIRSVQPGAQQSWSADAFRPCAYQGMPCHLQETEAKAAFPPKAVAAPVLGSPHQQPATRGNYAGRVDAWREVVEILSDRSQPRFFALLSAHSKMARLLHRQGNDIPRRRIRTSAATHKPQAQGHSDLGSPGDESVCLCTCNGATPYTQDHSDHEEDSDI